MKFHAARKNHKNTTMQNEKIQQKMSSGKKQIKPLNILRPVIFECLKSYKGSKVNCPVACSETRIALDRGSIKLPARHNRIFLQNIQSIFWQSSSQETPEQYL